MFRKLTEEGKIKSLLTVLLQMWTGILLIYTFEMKPLIGFLMSAVLWRLTRLDSKRKLNAKKLLLIALLVSVSGNDKFFHKLKGRIAAKLVADSVCVNGDILHAENDVGIRGSRNFISSA